VRPCLEGRLAPRGCTHCNASRPEHRILLCRAATTAARPSPSIPNRERLPLSLADAALDNERNLKPGRQKSLEAPQRALPLAAARGVSCRGRSRMSSDEREMRPLVPHAVTNTYSASNRRTASATSRGRASHTKPAADKRRGERFGRTRRPAQQGLYSRSRGPRRIRAVQSGPGPEVTPFAGGVDTDALPWRFCASCEAQTLTFACRQSPDGSPPLKCRDDCTLPDVRGHQRAFFRTLITVWP